MPRHVVQQGETFARIAAKYGFGDFRVLYEAPANASLRNKRPDPNVLFPGDEIEIPEPSSKTESGQTGGAMSFTIDRPSTVLRLVLKKANHEPLANEPFSIEFEGGIVVRNVKTDGDGKLEVTVPSGPREATLRVKGRAYRLLLGYLNPMKDTADGGISGVQARLKNLGYFTGPIDGTVSDSLKIALAIFQRDFGLSTSGEVDAQTISKLEAEHGA